MQSSADVTTHLTSGKIENENISVSRSVLQTLPLTSTIQTSISSFSQSSVNNLTSANTVGTLVYLNKFIK
ncbi:hypothetical protein PGB90_008536 [Kerria lacca]